MLPKVINHLLQLQITVVHVHLFIHTYIHDIHVCTYICIQYSIVGILKLKII